MKKFLLSLALGGIALSANAQLALQNFSGTSGLPTGWTLVNDGHTVSTSFAGGSLPDLTDSAWINVPISETGTTDALGTNCMLTTSYFSPAATADRWLITPVFSVTSTYMAIQWQDNDLGSGETMTVELSSVASTSVTSTFTSLYSAPAGSGNLVTHQVLIGAYAGTNVTVGFVDKTDNNWGEIVTNIQTVVLNAYDLDVASINVPTYVQTGASTSISGMLQNNGAVTVTSTDLDYSVNGGAPVVSTLSGLSIALGGTYNYTSSTPWVPSTAGTYTIKAWVNNINGSNPDANPSDDTITTVVNVIDSLQPRMAMVEEFNQASCDPCADAAPNVDSVYNNNLAYCNIVRYHVDWPGRDFMDSVTLAPFVQGMVNFYSVSGVPDAQLDGTYVYPGAGGEIAGYLNSYTIQTEAAQGSPFKIVVTPSYDTVANVFTATATVTGYTAIPAGLVLRACLTVDTITYANNQSTESIPQYSFPQVAENMFGGSAGNTLGAFTTSSTQTVNLSWTKNHPWATQGNTTEWAYDSTRYGQVVVWIQDNSSMLVYQSASAGVQVGYFPPLGVNAVKGNNGSLSIYPNPANSSATVALNLTTASNVKMEVYNMAGQLVYSMPTESRNTGTSYVTIDLSNYANGDYFVNVTMGNEVVTKKLTVIK